MTLYSCWKAFDFQLLQFLFHLMPHFDNVGIRRSGHHYSYRTLTVIKQFVAGRIFIIFLNTGNVTQPQLIGIMSLNQHTTDILHRLKLVTDCHPDTIIAIIIVTSISRLVLSVQCG